MNTDWLQIQNHIHFSDTLPYVEPETLSQEALEQRIRNKEMFHFSHTMEAQLGGLTKAGLVITGFYEDRRPEEDGNPIRHYMPSYYVVRGQKVAPFSYPALRIER